MPPLISVVIPVYNGADFVAAAISSALAQSYRPTEVIVVDDGSIDATAQIVGAYRDVHYICQANRGPSAARNTGIDAAHGEYIAFLDADDVWMPDKLAKQMALLESCPDAGLAFANMCLCLQGDDPQASMFEKYHYSTSFFGDERLVIDAPLKLVRTNFIPTSTVLARKRIVAAAGGFDEHFHKAEDWDLWLRIALRAPIAYTPDLLMLKRVHAVNTSRDAEGMNEAALQVLEKLKRDNHALLLKLGVDITGALRDGYRNLGYFYLRQVAPAQARAALRKSLMLGFHLRALIYFLSTLMGRRFVGSMIRARG